MQARITAAFGILLCCGSATANITGSGTNLTSSTSIASFYVGPTNSSCSETNPTYSSISCTVDNTFFSGTVSASLSNLSGNASLGSQTAFGNSIQIAAAFSETLEIDGGMAGSSGYIALPLYVVLGVADGAVTNVALGSQLFSDGTAYPDAISDSTGFQISQFQYGAPFAFSMMGSSYGLVGGNSVNQAGFSVFLHAPIILSSIPSGYSLGFNNAGRFGFFNPDLPLVNDVQPAGPNGAADVISAIPEPNTSILATALFLFISVSTRLRRRRRNLCI